ncbi:HNH endonuclease family protein [Streptomyces albidoflavus]|uniref:HNH endonuclease family protein n=1 Tax=Streptomyces albidoflavus TaxID=1886 RepID=UPI0033E01A8C
MIKKLLQVSTALTAAALALAAALPAPSVAAPKLEAPARALPLQEAVALLPLAAERREGYRRDLYKHWNRGENASDGCDTRREVILSEALVAPEVSSRCQIAGGQWESYYDGVRVTSASALDVDHIVPLAEVHDSGGYDWPAGRREAYANDQGSPLTLVAVTAKSNRSKADKDPAQWMPPAPEAHCRYAAEWVSTKLRWTLSADSQEQQALARTAQDCPTTRVFFDAAP